MKKTEKAARTGFRTWLLIWGLGLAGQICWNMENQWFNTFVYARIGKDPSIITGMLICSAAATTFATFFFGTWADRTGKRRTFISWGYILWGIFTIAFGLTQFISREMYLLVAVSVVLADTVMSFFGSMGNDAGFNTWTNDIMTDTNRGGVGAALATQPVLGTILGTVVGGFLVGSDDNYMRLFIVMGVFVIVFGFISMFALNKRDDVTPHKEGGFWRQFVSVFNFKRFFRLKELVLVHVAVSIFFIGFNVYFAYIGNYLLHYLKYTADQMGIIEAVPLVLAMLTAIPIGVLINKNKHPYIAIAAVAVNIIGLFILYPLRPDAVDPDSLFNLQIWLGIFVVGVGYVGILQTTKVWAKQLYPRDAKGQFEGIWILFFVLIPMIGGSLIGETVVKSSGETFVDELSGKLQYIPNGNIFLFGAIVTVLSLIPIVLSIRYHRARVLEEKAQLPVEDRR
ncbi:MAG: MFS transporter [Clostridia bacterium]|nr:MFS transporter [Clostridia bacterium]MBR0538266.1 MFS transporter [Clostridia bacterium]